MNKSLQIVLDRISELENGIYAAHDQVKNTIVFKRNNVAFPDTADFFFTADGNSKASIYFKLSSEVYNQPAITVYLNGVALKTISKTIEQGGEIEFSEELYLKGSGKVSISVGSFLAKDYNIDRIELTINGYNAQKAGGNSVIELVYTDAGPFFAAVIDQQLRYSDTNLLMPLKTYTVNDIAHIGRIYNSDGKTVPVIGCISDKKLIFDLPPLTDKDEVLTQPTLTTDISADDFAVISFTQQLTYLLRIYDNKLYAHPFSLNDGVLTISDATEISLFSGLELKALKLFEVKKENYLFITCLGGTYCVKLSLTQTQNGYEITKGALASLPVGRIESVYAGSKNMLYHRGRDNIILRSEMDLTSTPQIISTQKERYAEAYLRYMEHFILVTDDGELLNLTHKL